MASLVTTNDNNDAPDAIVVEAILVKDTFYTFIDSCEYHILALNSNGAVDHGRSNEFVVHTNLLQRHNTLMHLQVIMQVIC